MKYTVRGGPIAFLSIFATIWQPVPFILLFFITHSSDYYIQFLSSPLSVRTSKSLNTSDNMSSSPSTGSASPIDLTHLVLKERTISALLRKLDMDNRAEQLDFKRLLRFYMNWEPGFTDGFYRDELIKMKDVELHYYAKDFLDSAKLVSFNEPAGNTFWPSHAFISTSSPKPQPKRLTYAENRSDIIDLVTQILILQRKSTERKESEKKKKSRTRARNKQATAGSAAVQSTISETLEDKRGCSQ